MAKRRHKILEVEEGSIAMEAGIRAGDVLVAVNGREVMDVFDYRYLTQDESVTVLVERPGGEEWEFEIEKDFGEDLGLGFGDGLMDEYRSCRNKCIFCFIDQMPGGMRETLYFKDDDSRLSFLQGNYVTLTNMSDRDAGRIIEYRMEPINVSVHTTNPGLRCKMLNNRFAGRALQRIGQFCKAGISMNGQVVLCKGVNDGEELDRTIRDLSRCIPHMQSVSVVPVGLTRYREGLFPLEPFGREDAKKVLSQIHSWQERCLGRHGTRFVHASDEWYFLAGEEVPGEESYEGYPQLENGVGMTRLLIAEFEDALGERRLASGGSAAQSGGSAAQSSRADMLGGDSGLRGRDGTAPERRVTIATGTLSAPIIEQLSEECMEAFPWARIQVVPVRNDFFGPSITVSGLLTGRDLLAQLQEVRDGKMPPGGPSQPGNAARKNVLLPENAAAPEGDAALGNAAFHRRFDGLGDRLLLPCNMLRSGEDVFLDGMTVGELESALQVGIDIVESSGQALLDAMLGMPQSQGRA